MHCIAYKPIPETNHILFNYPRFVPYSPDDYILVAIYIPDNELFMKEYHQLFPKGSRWNTRQNVLICGHWKEDTVDGETASICEFTRPRKQLHLLKYD
mgnify:FL=1